MSRDRKMKEKEDGFFRPEVSGSEEEDEDEEDSSEDKEDEEDEDGDSNDNDDSADESVQEGFKGIDLF